MNQDPSYCAVCGAQLVRSPIHGYTLACCDGKGYWYAADPLPRDMRLAKELLVAPPKIRGFYLYLRSDWPKDRVAVHPDKRPLR